MAGQQPVVIQKGEGACRALVYLLHVDNLKPTEQYPFRMFDAIREACGPEPIIVVRGDDGTAGSMPIVDGLRLATRAPRPGDGEPGYSVLRIIAGGWSAGVRGIRRFLIDGRTRRAELSDAGAAHRLFAGIVACDGLHAPYTQRRAVSQTIEEADAAFALQLGPSEVFREYVELARRGEMREEPLTATHADGSETDGTAYGRRHPFAFVLTHCMQDYMEMVGAKPRYLSTQTVARALTGFDCVPEADGSASWSARDEGRLRVISFSGPRVDYEGHVRQQRVALPMGLKTMREWGFFTP